MRGLSYASRRIVLCNFPLSATWRAARTISRSTSIFSPRLICDCPCHWPHPHLHPHRHRTHRDLLVPSTPPASSPTSYSSRRIVQIPAASVPLKVALTVSGNSSIFSQRLIRDYPCGRHHHRMSHCWVLALGKLSVVNRCTLNVINRTGFSHNCLIVFAAMYRTQTVAPVCYHRDRSVTHCKHRPDICLDTLSLEENCCDTASVRHALHPEGKMP